LVSDLADWREMFVEPGYAKACDPADPESISAALTWFLENNAARTAMATQARAKIESEWNYDRAFGPILESMRGL
jgi:glycosyltransferase involved in cell wall biosynthesis